MLHSTEDELFAIFIRKYKDFIFLGNFCYAAKVLP